MELEACLKATKILAKFNRRLEAADFLQNTIYIGIKLEPDREIERLSTLAELYGMIGFKRKEAFYKRVAAMYCVQDQGSKDQNGLVLGPDGPVRSTGQSISSLGKVRGFRSKFCRESVTLRGSSLCCFSRQNFKWNRLTPNAISNNTTPATY